MKVLPKAFKIVQITSDCRLLDAEGTEHVYWRKDGCGLAKGWYVVSWPSGIATGRYNVDAQFRGPHRSLEEADATLRKTYSEMRGSKADPASREGGIEPALSGGALPQSRSRQLQDQR